jgi:tRNA (guanine10-N2)-dimethyltransferase
MNIIFELSKEYKHLAIDEIISCLKSFNINYKIIKFNQELLIISTKNNFKKIKEISKRLALTYNIGLLLFTSANSTQELINKSLKIKIDKPGSIAVSYRNRTTDVDSQKIIRTIASIITKNRKVDLLNPDVEIRCLITKNKTYVSINKFKIERPQFEKRKVQHRPFFSPISLHPKLSRVIVNLSEIKKNEILLDPFCGTGGILIEAGILGFNIIGNDIDKKLVEGCKKNLDFYNILRYKIYNLDIGKIIEMIDKVDVIVTDFPYGKSTTTKGEKIISLYKRAFSAINKLLKEERKAIIGLSNRNMIELGKNYLFLEKTYDIKVHNSLTRYINVYRKKIM